MRLSFLFLPVIAGLVTACSARSTDGTVEPVPFNSVRLTDQFWAPRIRLNHEVTIPIALKQSEETGRIRNFEIAGGLATGKFCSIFPFDDSDVFKIIEGASYSLQTYPDPELEAVLDTLIHRIGLAQEDDGYLFTYRTIMGDDSHPWVGKRWEKTHILSHELYNLGHLYEAAVAHFQATGKRNLLDIAVKSADLVDRDFGWGKFESYPGHQEVEIGLVKLYRATGEQRYLDLAKFFLDVRGPGGEEYCQAHEKVIEQDKAVGHSVRAGYMYSGMADVAALTADSSYLSAIRRIWEDMVYTKYYVTGGIGSTGGNEGFAEPFHLPNMTAYCETCASIAMVLWNYRMFLARGESKYIDVLERTLYNGLLSGVSLSGDRFFYPNPLESYGQHTRQEWFGCACCPSNICRFIPSVPGYLYGKTGDRVYINMFASSTAWIELDGNGVEIVQETNYPWDGKIRILLHPELPSRFTLMIRIPGWAGNEAVPGDLYRFTDVADTRIRVKMNNRLAGGRQKDGYLVIRRRWEKGDAVEFELPMPPRLLTAREEVVADRNKAVFQSGPLVYCAEWPDQPDGKVLNLVLEEQAPAVTQVHDLLNGVKVIKTAARAASRISGDSITLSEPRELVLIPYHAWANRGAGEMMVWLPLRKESCRPLPAPSIASGSRITASHPTPSLSALNDQVDPGGSNDRSAPHYHWWPARNTTEWVQYNFDSVATVSSVRVFWFDDGPHGGCRIPSSWRLLYSEKGRWKEVETKGNYPVGKDTFNILEFVPVSTDALRLEVTLDEEYSGGILEWIVN